MSTAAARTLPKAPPAPASPRRASGKETGARRAQADATRQRILDSALKAFAEHGFAGATTRDIAADAGVNHAMIGYHFRNKDQLWREAVTLMFARLNAELGYNNNYADLTAVEEYKEFIRRYVRYCARHPEHARIMVQESVRGGARLQWAVDRFIGPGRTRAGPVLEAQVAAGALPQAPMMSLYYSIFAACQIPFTLATEVKAVFGVDVTTAEEIERHAEAVIAIFVRESPDCGSDTTPAHERQPSG